MKKFDERFLRQLENLRLAVRKSVRGRKEGEWSTSRRGGTSDFVAHREYSPGDDPRSIDWPLYARLGELFVREFSREESLLLHLVVDSSSSMFIGSGGKHDLALQLAAGLGAVAWAESARVFFRDRFFETLGAFLPVLEKEGSKRESPEEALRGMTRGSKESGLVVFLSDLWEDSLRKPLLEASSHGDIVLLHILSPEEISPLLSGRHRLIDSENGGVVDRQVGPEELEMYQRGLETHCDEWKRWSSDHDIRYLRCVSNDDWATILTRMLREAGLYR